MENYLLEEIKNAHYKIYGPGTWYQEYEDMLRQKLLQAYEDGYDEGYSQKWDEWFWDDGFDDGLNKERL